MVTYSVRDEITEIINKLFIYTDQQDWERLQQEVFSADVLFDMSSMGGPKAETAAKDICAMWQKGFEGLDAINHLAGNYLVQINDHLATVFAYATATHYKASATKGTTREFVGTYMIRLLKHGYGWRIYEFKYDLKYQTGNLDLV
jgi:SnoaL-like domain